jgi:hypothetical protein
VPEPLREASKPADAEPDEDALALIARLSASRAHWKLRARSAEEELAKLKAQRQPAADVRPRR